MITAVLIFAERLARRRFRPDAQTLTSAMAAAAILLLWAEELFSPTVEFEPGRMAFELTLLVVSFSCLQMVVLGVMGSFATVWNRSSNLFIAVACYIFIGVIVFGLDALLSSHGLVRSDKDMWDWLNQTIIFGAGVTLLFGAIVWLTAAVREIIDNYRKLQRIERH